MISIMRSRDRNTQTQQEQKDNGSTSAAWLRSLCPAARSPMGPALGSRLRADARQKTVNKEKSRQSVKGGAV